jgi:hypothetical protein
MNCLSFFFWTYDRWMLFHLEACSVSVYLCILENQPV